MPELTVIFVVMIMLAIPVGIVIALVWYFSSHSKQPQTTQPTQLANYTQERLSEIDGLRSQNLISGTEYEERRRHILSGI
jgi:cytochrome c-type biogenesis protein CcmH/NrfG